MANNADIRESRIEREVCRRVFIDYGIRNVKLRESGYPDRLFLLPKGISIFIEFKAPGKNPSYPQEYVIGKLKEFGHHVYVFDNEPDAYNMLSWHYAKAIAE